MFFFLRFSKDRTLLAIFCCKYSSYSSISSPVSSLESQGSTEALPIAKQLKQNRLKKRLSYGVNSGLLSFCVAGFPAMKTARRRRKNNTSGRSVCQVH